MDFAKLQLNNKQTLIPRHLIPPLLAMAQEVPSCGTFLTHAHCAISAVLLSCSPLVLLPPTPVSTPKPCAFSSMCQFAPLRFPLIGCCIPCPELAYPDRLSAMSLSHVQRLLLALSLSYFSGLLFRDGNFRHCLCDFEWQKDTCAQLLDATL